MNRKTKLCILPGYRCNFACAHCTSTGKKIEKLTDREKTAIIDAVGKYGIKSLHFAGGEPSLYIRDINELLSRLPDLKHTKVRITTNGHFGQTVTSAIKLISSFGKLDFLQLSYDKFHEEFLPFKCVRNIYHACLEKNVGFSVAISVQTPLDLLLMTRLKKIGDFPVGVLKVMPAGAAQKNRLAYRYTSFDRKVLDKKCPNSKVITYMCGEGFTGCCSLLSFGKDSSRYAHATMSEHLNSRFHKLLSKHSFREIIRKAGLGRPVFGPEQSSICSLCAYLFNFPEVRKCAGL